MIAFRIANIALVVLLCIVAVKWGFVFFTADDTDHDLNRTPIQVKRSDSKTEVAPLTNMNLSVPAKKVAPIPAPVAPAPSISVDDIELKGVFANKNNPDLSLAILSVKGVGEVPTQVGDEIKPGVILNSVGTDFVLLSHSGKLTRLGFSKRTPDTRPNTGSSTLEGAETSPRETSKPVSRRSRQAPRSTREPATSSALQPIPETDTLPSDKPKTPPIVVAPALAVAIQRDASLTDSLSEPQVSVADEMQAEPVQTDIIGETDTAEPEITESEPEPEEVPGTTSDDTSNDGNDQQSQNNGEEDPVAEADDENIPGFMSGDGLETEVTPDDVPDFMKNGQEEAKDIPAFMQ